ncbi:MAG: omptin family outer membrane protease, partial [Spirochaetales bacterium]
MTNRRQFGVFLIVALLVGAGLPAEESSSSWEVAFNIRTAVRAGIMGEHVYSGDDTISYLEWELLPLVTVGPSIAFFTRFNTEARVTIELPVFRATGQMTDADYLDPTDRSTPTKLSTHRALVDSHRTVDVSLKQTIASNEQAAILVGLGYVDRFVKLIGYEGEFDYGSVSGDVTGV